MELFFLKNDPENSFSRKGEKAAKTAFKSRKINNLAFLAAWREEGCSYSLNTILLYHIDWNEA